MTSCIFLILFACPPSEDGHGRVVEVEDFGIAFAVGGDAAILEDAKPPLRPDEAPPDDEGPREGEVRPSIKALI